ncbi:MAG TPA: phosphonate metabolism transcriptional regulator PhnF [Devosia sp.]|nr:phosphonate metabolism transcriptional regulator PhnF [Devosia sp.]
MTIARRASDDRLGGVALWRRIADDIRLDIVGGKLARGDRLAGEMALAERFGVNRHTVRRALAVLEEEGVVRSEQGRGTFVDRAQRLSYRIGKRTRFSEGLAGQARSLERRLLSSRIENATAPVAKALRIRAGAKVVRLETLSLADGQPLSRATSWLDYRRFAEFPERFERARSVTAAFRTFGIADYARASTHISARHADADETKLLKLAPGAILLVSEAVDAEEDGAPIQYGLSRFPAERLELVV